MVEAMLLLFMYSNITSLDLDWIQIDPSPTDLISKDFGSVKFHKIN